MPFFYYYFLFWFFVFFVFVMRKLKLLVVANFAVDKQGNVISDIRAQQRQGSYRVSNVPTGQGITIFPS